MSPGQCYNKNTVPPSRYCMGFIIFANLCNSLAMGYVHIYICIIILAVFLPTLMCGMSLTINIKLYCISIHMYCIV